MQGKVKYQQADSFYKIDYFYNKLPLNVTRKNPLGSQTNA